MSDSINPKKKNGMVIGIVALISLLGGATGHNLVIGFNDSAEAQFIQDCKTIQEKQNDKLEQMKNEQTKLVTNIALLQSSFKTMKEDVKEQKELLKKIDNRLRWKR